MDTQRKVPAMTCETGPAGRRVFTPDSRLAAVAYCVTNLVPQREAARELGITEADLSRWLHDPRILAEVASDLGEEAVRAYDDAGLLERRHVERYPAGFREQAVAYCLGHEDRSYAACAFDLDVPLGTLGVWMRDKARETQRDNLLRALRRRDAVIERLWARLRAIEGSQAGDVSAGPVP